jgi:hypothetical protein
MRILKNLRIDEVSCVLKGASPGAKVVIRKADDDTPSEDTPRPLEKLTEMVVALCNLMPNLSPAHAVRFLATPPGTAFISSLSKKEQPMPQVDIFKLHNEQSVIEIAKSGALSPHDMSAVVMGHAKLAKRDKESEHQAYARIVDSNIEIRRALLKSLPNMMSVEVVSTEVGSTSVVSDAWKAAAQLQAKIEQQRRLAPTLTRTEIQEMVYADPDNKLLVAQAHPTTSSTSGDELQRDRP